MSMSTAEAELSWLAIQQPGVVRLLEEHLHTADGDALAAGLELAWRLLGDHAAMDGVPVPRLPPHLLAAGLAARPVPPPSGDLEAELAALPLVLTRAEERAVAQALAAVRWAVAEVRTMGDFRGSPS